MKTRFFNALKHFKVDYNEETGRLSDPITIIAYRNRKYVTSRLFIVDDSFHLMDGNTSRKISFDKIHSFKLEKDEPLLEKAISSPVESPLEKDELQKE